MSEKEYIERGALVGILDAKSDMAMGTSKAVFASVAKMVELLPAADVVEVRHGEWKQATEPCGWHDVDCVVCSACGESWVLDGDFDFDVVKDFWNYCPNCGARMDGERKDKP